MGVIDGGKQRAGIGNGPAASVAARERAGASGAARRLGLLLILCCLGLCARATPSLAQAQPKQSASEAGELSPAERLGQRQQQIAGDFRHFQDVLLRMAELTAATDPRRAALLRKAVRQSEERLIGMQLESLAERLQEGRLSRAIENQENLLRDLEDLLELLLSEDRARRAESEKARVREYLQRLTQIIRQQKGIQGRTGGAGDPKALTEEQDRLADRTGRLAGDIKRDEPPVASTEAAAKTEARQEPQDGQRGGEGNDSEKGPPAAQSNQQRDDPAKASPAGEPATQESGPRQAGRRLETARQRMEEAREKLEEAARQGAVEKQEDAIRELELAKADLEEILRQLREEEIGRVLATLEDRFKKMLRLEQEVYAQTVRLDAATQPEPTYDHQIAARRLSRRQAEIVLEADKALALLHDDGTAVAFPEATEQVRQDMLQVVRRLDQAQVGRVTQAIEEEIVAALEEMIEALRQAEEEAEKPKRRMRMLLGQPQEKPLVDLLAELRMIRSLQVRVNRRTERYSKLIDGEQAQDPDLLQALRGLAQRQRRISQITQDLETGANR